MLSANRVDLLRLQWMVESYKQRVGARIREAREAKHWSQPQLSRRMPEKVTASYISRWETGRTMPGTRYLELLAEALDVDVSYFLADAPAPSSEQTNPLDAIQATLIEVLGRLDRMERRLPPEAA